jgi:L-fuconolactonase
VSTEGTVVIDAHVHFWDPARLAYPWLREAPPLQRAYLPGDYAPLATGAVDAIVFVEANCASGAARREVDWVDELAAGEPRIAGIVAFVDLLDEAGREAALRSLRELPRVVGVRHNIQQHAPGFALQPAFVRGVQAVGALALPFDLCVTADQLPEVLALVERCPDTRFILDHCGKPAIRDDAFDDWARDLALLAAHERVACKLSGLLTEARADQRSTESMRPWLAHARECFGADRVLYGSDWPVCTLAGGEPRWRAIVHEATADWPAAERRALFGDNAARVYGLEAVVHG